MSEIPKIEHSDDPFPLNRSIQKYWNKEAHKQKNKRPTTKELLVHSILFILTFISVSSTLLVGMGLQIKIVAEFLTFPRVKIFQLELYLPLLLSLTVHELRHYFAALYHRVCVSYLLIYLTSRYRNVRVVIKILNGSRYKKPFDIGAAGQ